MEADVSKFVKKGDPEMGVSVPSIALMKQPTICEPLLGWPSI
jgi:hypothetical protein